MNGDQQYTLGQIPGQQRPLGQERRYQIPGQEPAPPEQPHLGVPITQWEAARALAEQRRREAAGYAAQVRGGLSAAQAQQRLGLGGLQQQQMGAIAGGPLMQRAAMYGQARAADQMLGEMAARRMQEQMAAEAMRQQTIGGIGEQYMSEAEQAIQLLGIEQQAQLAEAQTAQQRTLAEQAELDQMTGAVMGAGGAGMGMLAAASDRRLKTDIRKPRTRLEQELLEALMGADHA